MFSTTKVMTLLLTSLLIFLAIELTDMGKDTTAFKLRFEAYKNGKSVSEIYDAGLPRYAGGKPELVDDTTLDFIIKHEGFVPDTLGKDPVTGAPYIGSGIEVQKYLDQFNKTGKWSAEDNRNAVRELVIANRPYIRQVFGEVYDTLTDALKGVIDDVAYNIGVGKLNKKYSPGFVQAVLSGNNEEAKRQIDWGNHLAKGLANRNKHRLVWWDSMKTVRPPSYIARKDNYDYETAEKLGYGPDKTGHWPSRNYKTGEYLKSATHPTIMKTIISDIGLGYNTTYNKDAGKLGSQTWMKSILPRPENILLPMIEDDEWEPKFPGLKNGKLPILKHL